MSFFVLIPVTTNASERRLPSPSEKSMSSSRIATLLAWSTENRIQIDSRLQIIDGSPHHSIVADEPTREHGFSVYSRDESIECACTRESPVFQTVGPFTLFFENVPSPNFRRLRLSVCTNLSWVSQSCIFQRPPFYLSSPASSPST